MDSFLYPGDYIKLIQADNLTQIIGNNQSVLDSIQAASVEECVSYLKQKYDTSIAFRSVTIYDPTKNYSAGLTVYLSASAYSATSTYALGKLVSYNNIVYKCSTAITVPEAWNANHWTALGNVNDLFNSVYPQSIFDSSKLYSVGDKVFWKDKVYTCAIASPILNHDAQLQVNSSASQTVVNIYPDDQTQGVKYWGAGVSYSALGTDLLNTTYWMPGDGRDQKLVEVCVNIALYKAHIRIAPRNIPELRIYQYMGYHEDREVRGQRILYPTYSALGWLQAASIGNDITPELPLIQPASGKRIQYGGNFKHVNSY